MNLWFLYKFMKKDYCQRRFKDVVVWVVSSPGSTWARFTRGSRPLSIYQTTTNTPSRSVTTALRCGWVQYVGRATILRREATTTTTTSSMRPGAVAGSGILVGQPSWNVKQTITITTTTTSSMQPDDVAGCGISVGQRPWGDHRERFFRKTHSN